MNGPRAMPVPGTRSSNHRCPLTSTRRPTCSPQRRHTGRFVADAGLVEVRERDPSRIEVIALEGIPEVRPGDNLAEMVVQALEATLRGTRPRDDDVLVVTQKV